MAGLSMRCWTINCARPSNRSSLLIIRDAVFAGVTRFSDFERRLGIAPNILAKRLDGFVTDGLMDMSPVDQTGPSKYVLTDKGRELGLVVMALVQWGDRWATPLGPPMLFEHGGCAGSVRLHATCDRCGREPVTTEIVTAPGPGLDEQRSAH